MEWGKYCFPLTPLLLSVKKNSNKVLAQIETLNIVDMSRICRQLVDVNTTREQESPQCDGMYNNPFSSGVGVRHKLSTLDLLLS